VASYTVAAHQARLEAAFQRAQSVNDLQLQADFARYLCVLVAGYLEQATRHIMGDFAVRKAHPHIGRYVERRLKFFTNANSQKLCDLVGDFDAEARVHLEAFLAGERKDAINSVVANRHEIAHGRDVGLTLIRISEYHKHVAETVEFLQGQFN
jgi:HEPN superfamily RiboL-PSP-like protein